MPAAMSLSHQGRSKPERARTPRAALAGALWPQHHIPRPPPDLQSSPMSAVAIMKHRTAAWTPLVLGQSFNTEVPVVLKNMITFSSLQPQGLMRRRCMHLFCIAWCGVGSGGLGAEMWDMPSVPGVSGKGGLPMRPCIREMSAGFTGRSFILTSTSEALISGLRTSWTYGKIRVSILLLVSTG